MSLICWLPLNQDLHNQGISNLVKANVSAATVLENNGKIGKCYTNTGTTASAATPLILNTIAFSACAWVRINTSRTNWCRAFGMGGTNTYFGLGCEHSNGTLLGFHFYKTIDGTNTSIFDNYPTSKQVGTWVHYAMTYDGEKAYLYENGNLLNTLTIATARQNTRCEMTNLYLFGGTSGNYSQCSLNDVRIYDHCLSAVEVKEIAQGLVLHYKLDNQHETSLRNKYSSPYSDGECSSSTWTKTKLTNERGWNYKLTKTGNGSNSWPNCGCPVFTFTSGKRHQYSVKVRCNKWTTGTLSLRASRSSNDWVTSAIIVCSPSLADGQWHEYCVSQIINDTYDRAGTTVTCAPVLEFYTSNMNGDGTIYDMDFDLKDIQVVESDTYVPFINNAFANNSITDSSGYNHNGTIVGSVVPAADTARYGVSTCINGAGVITAATPGADIRTLSCWVKTTKNKSTSQMLIADSASNMCISFYAGTIIGVFGATRSTGSKCTLGASYKENDWNHIVVVKTSDNGKRDIYCNGAKLTPAADDYWSATAGFFVGNRNSTVSGNTPFFGYISDVRAYCTQLLDTDIKQLYNVGMKVDNKGNIHAYEFKEQSGETKFEKTGVIRTFEINDNKYYDNKGRVGKQAWEDILHSSYYAITTKDSHTATGSIPSIPAATIQSLAGKTLRFSYDVCTLGDRLSTENGDTAWNKIRYGIHGAMSYVNASGTSGTSYPFAGLLEYSGDKKHCIQTWTIPTGYQSYGDLAFSPQPFDRPGSTNNNTWFLNNVKLEISSNTAPGGWVSGTQIIER